MPTSAPLHFTVPADGVVFAESVHAGDFRMSERTDPFHKVLYVQRGRVALQLGAAEEGPVLEAGAGTLLIVPAGQRHRLTDVELSVLLLLGFGKEFVDTDADLREMWNRLRRSQGSSMRLRPVQAGPVVGCWRQGILEQTEQRRGHGVAARMLALQVLLGADRYQLRAVEDSTAERVTHLLEDLETTFYRPWSIDLAAHQVGLSRRQFTLRFREQTGKSFVEYLNALRLAHAERLLRSGRYSVTGAAFSSGFEDLSHFYRLFRGRHGVAPKQWMADQATTTPTTT
ncbi:helix-turn-helix domain-containing protein [Actomonas aquatica]|uniref:Helix-turn-helix domain-containing protein n=1 Tax=Actomonas aquatica TaxID=2866162 RepID=A0ABZ1CD11_9BACT|nr:helix-turn-helix domain-containing protein [Opitutus sp. WL0086]WRQ89562.1 helix-turn-helix domain-containing protein [Opitutus sp. WL0086]